ncbi:choice-of-anchor E domain-containing protein [Cronbergia sp. UHCC 0137]|uniref:choice-of-anchor E domain-containing protein n=1 Tax=Cronbergia sp. UHCC 0137 TaxID=3110239 RepID=UPI002B1ED28A|nr:choice-of-anchor E domain-containing protein [Cronbergia sp. UHCC 0137]MEA5616393.1 choice-of-anchor E domain-containing protein [Cronbergia sp. UHCC 0137]
MNNKLFNTLAVATTIAGVVAAGSAQAATLTFTDSVSTQLTDIIDAPLSVQQFNPSLGTLDSVEFEFSGSITGNASVTNTSNSLARFRLSLGGDLSLIDALDSQSLFSINPSTISPQYSLAVGGTLQTPTLTATDLTSQTYTSGAFFQSFIGTGNRNFLFSALAESGIIGSGNLTSTITTLAGGDLTVTYNYTEAPQATPEPSALLAFGLISGFGLFSQSKKSFLKFSKS